jgi:hypothetical protein
MCVRVVSSIGQVEYERAQQAQFKEKSV